MISCFRSFIPAYSSIINFYSSTSLEKDNLKKYPQAISIRHLIADHLGWFKESTQDGNLRTIEDLLKEKGEKGRRDELDLDEIVNILSAGGSSWRIASG